MTPRTRRLLIAAGVLLLVVLVGGRLFAGLYTEALWFGSIDLGSVFWRRIGAVALVRVVTTLIGGAIVLANVWWGVRRMGPMHVRRRYANIEIAEKIPRRLVVGGAIAVSALAGWWLSAIVFDSSAALQLYFWARHAAWNVSDPLFGHDVGFYVFTLPALGRLLNYLLLLVFWTGLLTAIGYVLIGSIRWEGNRLTVFHNALLHLAGIAAALLVLIGVAFFVGRYALLIDGTGIGQSLGYADAKARIPAHTAILALALVAAVAVVQGARKRSWVAPAFGVGGFVLGGMVLGAAVPALVQKFAVEPNELAREAPYIRWNIEFTRQAYGLDRMTRMPAGYNAQETSAPDPGRAVLDGLPRWDQEPLQTVYNQKQTFRGFYTFPHVGYDRYGPSGAEQLVAIAVREFRPEGLQEAARTWQTLRLNPKYIRGWGAVVTPATQVVESGEPPLWLASLEIDRSPAAPPSVRLDEPSVFFGETMRHYVAYVPGRDSAYLSTRPKRMPLGIALSNPLRLAALAWRFGDKNLLFSSELTDDSRFLYRRQVRERLAAVAPFILWDSDAHPVLYDGHIVWQIDGYTATSDFPLSRGLLVEQGTPVRYLRASVKGLVDAVTGAVSLYSVDALDPVLETYRRGFPSLFHPLSDMPEPLRRHLRYPALYLQAQSRILTEYHLDSPEAFYAGQDVWEVSKSLGPEGGLRPYEPTYVQVPLPGSDDAEFLLMLPFIARDRQNMTAVVAGRSDGDHYGELTLIELPRDIQVPGPSQVQSMIEQDPAIAQTLTLWRQAGSDVDLGHLRVVPARDGILYMEPLYLSARENPIPELRRVIVSDGHGVVMAGTLGAAVAALGSGAPPPAESAAPETSAAGSAAPAQGPVQPRDALELLDRAQGRLRRGDWAGFGSDLDSLRALLERWSQNSEK